MYMEKKEKTAYTRTTVWIPSSLHQEAKVIAALTRSCVSHLMIAALKEKIEKIKKESV